MACCEFKILFLVLIGSLVNGGRQLQVPCYFIFGDSLVDNGNNNGLVTAAKANYAPYGIDFPDGPTGRFTNGRNIADILAEHLGFENYISPFANVSDKDMLRGVNYGSGAAGIRDETGQQLGGRISLNEQLQNHKATISRIEVLLGSKDLAKEYISKCLYTVGMGNNDYINNYFLPQYYPTSTIYTPQQYAESLIQQYSQQIMTLYNYGARKVALFGLGDIGCTPFELTMYGTNGSSSCVQKIDNTVQLFNIRLKLLVDELNNNLTDATFIFINQTSSGNSSSTVFTVPNAPCCRASTNIGKGECVPKSVPCSNRSEYEFWDEFHPTEAANLLLAASAYTALSPFYASSIDILGPEHGDKYISSV